MQRFVFPFVIATSLAAGALLALAEWQIPAEPSAFWNCVAALLVLAFVAESAFLKLPLGSATSSVAFIPYLASLILIGPAWTMGLAAVTEILVETAVRKKPPIKVLFNTSNQVAAIGVAGLAYGALGGRWSVASFGLAVPGFIAAAGCYFLVNTGGTAVVIGLSTGERFRDTWRRLAGGSILFDLLASPLALLLAFLYVRAELIGILVVGVPLFLVRHIYSVNLKLEQVNRDLLELMVKAIEARDPYTSGHSLRVSRLARALAVDLGLAGRQVEQIETAALLHDVGKIYEEYAPILRKAGPLTPEEAALMRTHPIRSYELVRTISGFRGGVDEMVRFHHENFDGSGYPDGLAGEDIPLGARIIMVADTTDAMITDRPYRRAMDYPSVVRELEHHSGHQFDPDVVDVFKRSAPIRSLVDEFIPQEGITIGQPSRRRALAVH